MNFTPGYIIGPSSGTLSVANGTTSPMVCCFVMDGSLVSRQYNLFDADADASDDPGPARSLFDDMLMRLLRRAGSGLHAERGEEILRLRRHHDFSKSAVEPVHDRLRHLRRAGHQLPGVGLIAGDAGLVERRHFGQVAAASRSRNAERLKLARFDQGRSRPRIGKIDRHMACDDVILRKRATPI